MALVERLAPKAAEYPAKAWQGPLVVTHGDYRLDNLLFSDGDKPTATVIDWQSVLLGPPLIDAGIFLGTCLTPEARREHQDDLLKRFHDGLVAGGVTGFSFDDCRESFRICSLYVFLLGVGTSVMLQQTERGDQMFVALLTQTAELVDDLGAAELHARDRVTRRPRAGRRGHERLRDRGRGRVRGGVRVRDGLGAPGQGTQDGSTPSASASAASGCRSASTSSGPT